MSNTNTLVSRGFQVPLTEVEPAPRVITPPDPSLDGFWRCRVADRCGGAGFDEPGSGYSFSAVLAEERELEQLNQPGDPSSALLKLSIADPTDKMSYEAFATGIKLFHECPDASRYTDLAGVRAGNGTDLGDTHEEIVKYLIGRFPQLADQLTVDWVQYSPGAIKRALAEYIPAAFFINEGSPTSRRQTQLLYPKPGYGVIKDAINRRGAIVTEIPLENHNDRWQMPFPWDFQLADYSPVLYLNVPHNPTGMTYDVNRWMATLCWARDVGAIVVVDEAYIDLCYRHDACSVLTIPGWEANCIVLQSVSKGWDATGLRFGWIVAHPTAIKVLRKVMDLKDSGMFAPSIAAGLECLRNPVWTTRAKQRYEQLHRLLNAGLREAGFNAPMPEAGLCQFTPAPVAVDGHRFGSIIECAKWFRQTLRVSLMDYELGRHWYLRWAVTIKPVPECDLPTRESVIAEVCRRLGEHRLSF
ncbi:MAG: hypothetical protein A3J59_03820 [Candidatus Buchananbacteria bacterium RIFCSPHIGHO2_02_FULL_56_16]|uniref:Aminotransferase class I/classII large domain-containing protein n=1 Tax=Candidatus Buchananbacteria bacterium RIFCSPHIGHO2_02_FULL_56_16 TaxID=1797542 RepID=A0A1G1YIA4_9BACT|nr:MAG: hypothetical protein A3J59_03820 [Candidatus Buchananbacteria bacterium RIFCSPHIGHO2_02_FULL_56_16]